MKNTNQKLVRVILWGCGIRGKQIYHNIVSSWKNWIEIVGFADNNADAREKFLNCMIKEDICCNCNIYDINDVEKMYKNKEIDGVIIGVSKKEYYRQIKEQLEACNILIYEYPTDDSELISAEDMPCEKTYVADGKLQIYVLQDVNVAVDNVVGTTWIYNHNNQRIKEGVADYYDIESIPPQVPLENVTNPAFFLGGEICILSVLYTGNYWHFLYEALVKILLLEESHYQGRYMIFDKPYIRELVQLLQLQDDKIVWVNTDTYKAYRCEKAYVYDITDSAFKKSMEYLDRWAKGITNKYFGDMATPSDCHSRIFVKRIGIRKLKGAESVLERYGFHTIIPEELSVLEQIKVFYFADIVVTPHGANSSNVLFMKDGKTFVETFGYQYVNPCCMSIIKRKNIDYHMLVEKRNLKMQEKKWEDDYEIPELYLDVVLGNVCAKMYQ